MVITLSLITSNTGGQSKKMIVSGMIWFGGCIGNIAGPFFYKTDQAPAYHLGIGSLLVANCSQLCLCFVLRYCFMWENKKRSVPGWFCGKRATRIPMRSTRRRSTT